jgi:DNA-binding SARP family transcriptional activator/WD40 repeat protein
MWAMWKTGTVGPIADRSEGNEQVEYRMLGPVEVRRDGAPLDLGVYKQRALLALLLVHANQVVSTDRIIDELWGEDAGRDRQNALWVVVSRLRSILEPGRERRSEGTVLVTRAPGYLLAADPNQIDASRFESLVAEGRSLLASDPGAASLVLHESLALWRGHVLEEFTYEPFAAATIARLEEMRLTAVEDRVGADLRLGNSRELVGELEGLVHQHPLREGFTAHLMVALYRSGRQGEALRAFGALRDRMVEELGLEPSASLAGLEERIVLDDPDLLVADGAPRSLPESPHRGLSVRGYELRDKIGEGPLGEVFRGYQPAIGREVSIKVVRPELANQPEFIRRFEAGAHLIAALEHPNVAPILDYWREPDSAYLVMRRFDHGTLADLLDAGPISTHVAMRIIHQIASGLAAAHRRGVVHGDLQPTNVLMDAEGNAYVTGFVTSFGVGHPQRVASPGLDPFVSPERRASAGATPSSDLYALGAISKLMLRTADGDSREVTWVIDRATADHPEDRFPDVESFATAVRAAIGVDDPMPATPTEVANPYRGLRAFGEDDASSFFGRERLVERLVARLGQPGSQGRLVALVGPSGSGKSSAVRAGVVPAIRQAALPRSDEWFVLSMTPGRHPFEALEDAVRTVAVNPPTDLLERLRTEGISAATSVMADPAAQLVLFVDQLEEVFSLATPSDAGAFLETLVAAAGDKHSRVKVIATLRADFYDHPLRHRAFGEALRLGTEAITPMSGDELERAITGPAETVGVTFEPGLVARIVSDLPGQSAALPLLQYTLTELFERRTGATITGSAYDELGGVTAALAGRADALYEGLAADARRSARDVFLRLVTVSEGAADTRRRALRPELEDAGGREVAAVIETFGRHRLLTFDRDAATRSPTVEIAHEALLTEWDRLARWIDDARDDVQAQRRLAAAATEWEERGGDPGFLLGGARLGRYDGWLDQPPVRLTDRERRFLTASTDAARDAAAAERRQVRRLRRLVAGIGAALVVALAAAGIAGWQQQRARVAAEEARAQTAAAELATLISRSAAVGPDDPELGLLLALEAHRRNPGPDTDQAVLRALGGASIANRILTRSPLVEDCSGQSAMLEVHHGEVEFATAGGRMLIRDPLVGETVDLGPPPAPCAVGAIHDGVGAAVTLDLSRAWIGADLGLELAFEAPTIPEWITEDRFVLRTGLFEDEPDVVTLHDVATGTQLGAPVSGEIWLDVAPNADESVYAVSFVDRGLPEVGSVFLLDGATGEELARVELDGGPQELAFDPVAGDLIVGLLGGRVVTLDVPDGAVLGEFQVADVGDFLAISPRPDGLITVVSSAAIAVIDPETGTSVQTIELRDAAQGFVRSDGLVVTRDLDGQIDVFDLGGSALVERSWRVDPTGLAAFHAGRAAVLTPTTQEVEVVELASGERFSIDLAGASFAASVAYPEPDGAWLVSADHELARWRDGELVERLSLGSTPEATGVLLGRTLPATRYGDTLAVLGRRADGTLETSVVTLNGGGAVVDRIVQTPDAFTVHPGPDGRLFVVTAGGVVRTHDRTGSLVGEFPTGQADPYVVTLDPSGRLLALGSEDGGVTTLDTVTGEAVSVSPDDQVANLGLGPDGRLLVIAHRDGTVRLWDTERREPAGVILNGQGAVTGEPGWYDASTGTLWMGASGSLVEIPLDPTRWVEKACEVVARDLTPEEWGRYVPGDMPISSACE